MGAHVDVQLALLRELFRTGSATEGLLPCMHPPMDLQRVLARKFLDAEVALKGFLSSVGSFVDCEVLTLCELFKADVTLIRLLTRMRPHMDP